MTYRIKTIGSGVEEKPRRSQWTPRDAAYSIAIDWLRATFEGRTNDLASYNLTPAGEIRARRQIAKLHNRLLTQSGLDGMNLDEEVSQ